MICRKMLWLEGLRNTMEPHNFPIKSPSYLPKGKLKTGFHEKFKPIQLCLAAKRNSPASSSHPTSSPAVHSCHCHCARLTVVKPHGEAGQPVNLAEE